MVEATSAVSADIDTVYIDGSLLGLDSHLVLFDDGTTQGDWAAGDGVWTCDLDDSLPGLQENLSVDLPIVVRDAEWNTYQGELAVTVLAEAPAAYYRNVSGATGATYSGRPSGIAGIDLADGAGDVDGDRDVYVSVLNDGVGGDDFGTTLYYTDLQDDVPQFYDQGYWRFDGQPMVNHGPATSADLRGDGLADLIIPAGLSTEGLRIYYQLDNGEFIRKPAALQNIPAAMLDSTWSAACGDYDGDGQVDVYLCRSIASSTTDLPGPGGAALADLLLLNDLLNSGTFIDASSELEIPVDSQGSPIHLASTAASWCDFDNDGDLDLAVADGAAGMGVFIYENDPDQGNERFSLIYPSNAATSPWPHSVSDLAWADISGDGWMDLVATTFAEPPAGSECYLFVNNGLVPIGPFSEPTWQFSIAADHGCTGMRILDHDLDGDLDILILPDNADASPLLMLSNNYTGWIPAPANVGLAAMTGETHGALVTDFDANGTADLLLGRQRSDFRFFCLADSAATDWVGLDLYDLKTLTDQSTRPSPAIGATVQIATSAASSVRFTVGADGRRDPSIRIGIEEGFEPTCSIQWPSGHSYSSELDPSTVNVLFAPTTVDYVANSVSSFAEVRPGEVVDWVFQWSTTFRTEPRLDRVIFEEPLECQLQVSEIDLDTVGVTTRQWYDTSGQNPVYRHELRWANRPCLRCSQTYHVEFGRSGVIESTEIKTFNSKLCTTVPTQ
jgi:hypothetical protein